MQVVVVQAVTQLLVLAAQVVEVLELLFRMSLQVVG
jgi:hypothetical protein